MYISKTRKKRDHHQGNKSRVTVLMNKLIYYFRVTKNKNASLLSHANSRFMLRHIISINKWVNIIAIVFLEKKQGSNNIK